ncbi:xanthine dehydrogenase accessory protein XdhC [Pararobbsia silviterrae]|uniref:Xanthine dehydrogenase accessory protein XdhC n=1 Tax=Pararobbsia silviterrae TaxID=1792498 RepID=A0A494Y9A1_9BURK|nr:xanthine dehydrogenase accessory protein XdhC [Pararobbsia silviterrae]RKP59231.1 xanthine dehydrogenase accessory protein XdhC [Pararobbsia silviterrae]
MDRWLQSLQQTLVHGDAAVLVTVARTEGSAPRDAGTKMVVTREAIYDTIGGGHLEFKAIDIARQVLREGAHGPTDVNRRLERMSLGPSLGQCCGGVVVLSFERLTIADLGWVKTLARRLAAGQATVRSVPFDSTLPVMLSDPEPGCDVADCLLWTGDGTGPLLTETIAARRFHVVLFGAGHVGAALVDVLRALPCSIHWVDARDAQFPKLDAAQWPSLTIDANDTPEYAVDTAPPGSYFLVMTHSHALDQTLCERILRRADYAYFGLIGSHTKRKQFEHRLAARGIDPHQIARMVCPIGVAGIVDKAPEVIAISVAAQLLQVVDMRVAHARPVTA